MKSPCFDLFIHWLIKQITNTYRNHFSRCLERRIDDCTLVSAERPEDKEVVKYKKKLVTAQESFEAVFHYQDYEFDHEDKFGLRGYIYDIDSRGSAILKVCRV